MHETKSNTYSRLSSLTCKVQKFYLEIFWQAKIPEWWFTELAKDLTTDLASSYTTTRSAILPPFTTPGTTCLHTNASQYTAGTLLQLVPKKTRNTKVIWEEAVSQHPKWQLDHLSHSSKIHDHYQRTDKQTDRPIDRNDHGNWPVPTVTFLANAVMRLKYILLLIC